MLQRLSSVSLSFTPCWFYQGTSWFCVLNKVITNASRIYLLTFFLLILLNICLFSIKSIVDKLLGIFFWAPIAAQSY